MNARNFDWTTEHVCAHCSVCTKYIKELLSDDDGDDDGVQCALYTASTMIEQIQKKISSDTIACKTAWISGKKYTSFFLHSSCVWAREWHSNMRSNLKQSENHFSRWERKKKKETIEMNEIYKRQEIGIQFCISFRRSIFGLTTKNKKKTSIHSFHMADLVSGTKCEYKTWKIWSTELYTRLLQREHFFFCKKWFKKKNRKKIKPEPDLESVHGAPSLFELRYLNEIAAFCKILIITNAYISTYCNISRYFLLYFVVALFCLLLLTATLVLDDENWGNNHAHCTYTHTHTMHIALTLDDNNARAREEERIDETTTTTSATHRWTISARDEMRKRKVTPVDDIKTYMYIMYNCKCATAIFLFFCCCCHRNIQYVERELKSMSNEIEVLAFQQKKYELIFVVRTKCTHHQSE